MPALPKAILFDLDDTILSFAGREALLIEVAEEFLKELTPRTPVEVAAAVEATFAEFWSTPGNYSAWRTRILEARTLLVGGVFERWGLGADTARRFAERFHDRRENGQGRLYPGAIDTILELRKRGVKLALVTNGHADTQREKVVRFNLAPLFDHVQIEGEVGFGKPEARAYRHAMEALGVEPHETWMVGDHLEWEVAAPQRLGIFAIWHDHLGKGIPLNSTVVPDRIVRAIPELLL